ncbi:glycosyltransferase family 39 protein [Streptacidiphilus monticola]
MSLGLMLATTALLYSLIRRLFNERVALGAAAVYAVLQSTVVQGFSVSCEALGGLLLVCSGWIAVRAGRRPWRPPFSRRCRRSPRSSPRTRWCSPYRPWPRCCSSAALPVTACGPASCACSCARCSRAACSPPSVPPGRCPDSVRTCCPNPTACWTPPSARRRSGRARSSPPRWSVGAATCGGSG